MQSQITPRLARMSEAIKYTSFSRSTLYRAMESGELKPRKIGGSIRFEYVELDRWIDTKTQTNLEN